MIFLFDGPEFTLHVATGAPIDLILHVISGVQTLVNSIYQLYRYGFKQ